MEEQQEGLTLKKILQMITVAAIIKLLLYMLSGHKD